MLRMWQFKDAFSRFHGHSINYLHKYCIFHLELSSSDSFSSPPVHPPESNQVRMCITLNWAVWAVYHQLTSRCWHCCCIHTWQSQLPVCLKFPVGAMPAHRLTSLYSLNCSRSIYMQCKAIVNWSTAFFKNICLARGIHGAKVHLLASQQHLRPCVFKNIFQIKGSVKSHQNSWHLTLSLDVCSDACSLSFSSIWILIVQNASQFVLICCASL